MSLVLAGAQQTLLLVALVVSARLALGFVLGALAGWLNGTWMDRMLLGLGEVIAAFPTLLLAMTLILWVAAIMSAFVDNIPFTATMLPIVAYLTKVIPGSENTLWWALAVGACFGGNGTIIGASANVVTMGIAESKGYKISFIGFMKPAFPYMIISILIAQAWIMIFRPV